MGLGRKMEIGRVDHMIVYKKIKIDASSFHQKKVLREIGDCASYLANINL
jgi:hypothetical protein